MAEIHKAALVPVVLRGFLQKAYRTSAQEMRRNASHLSHTARWIYLTGMGSGNQRLSGGQRRLAGRNSTDCHLEWRADNRGLLTEDELEIVYGYSVKVMENMVDFWYDKDM